MNSSQSEPSDDHDHDRDTPLNLSAARLDVFRHERLDYTEVPVKNAASRPASARTSEALKAMFHWILSRS